MALPSPWKPQLQKLTSRTGLSTSETSPTADGALLEGARDCCGGSPALGPGLLPGSRPGVSGNPTLRGYLCTPRSPHRTGAKGALGSRPVASAERGEDCGGSGDCWRGVRYTVGKNVRSLGERSGTPREPESAAR